MTGKQSSHLSTRRPPPPPPRSACFRVISDWTTCQEKRLRMEDNYKLGCNNGYTTISSCSRRPGRHRDLLNGGYSSRRVIVCDRNAVAMNFSSVSLEKVQMLNPWIELRMGTDSKGRRACRCFKQLKDSVWKLCCSVGTDPDKARSALIGHRSQARADVAHSVSCCFE